MSKPKVYPDAQEIWAAVYAAAFVTSAKDHAETRGHGWKEWVGGKTELAVGTAEDAATLADWAVEALKEVTKNE